MTPIAFTYLPVNPDTYFFSIKFNVMKEGLYKLISFLKYKYLHIKNQNN